MSKITYIYVYWLLETDFGDITPSQRGNLSRHISLPMCLMVPFFSIISDGICQVYRFSLCWIFLHSPESFKMGIIFDGPCGRS